MLPCFICREQAIYKFTLEDTVSWLPPAPLEDWLRDRYFSARTDISSSGVHPYSIADLFRVANLTPADMPELPLSDSRSAGDPRLRAAIATRWGDGDADRVLAANGSSEAIFLCLAAILEPGDEVVVLWPAYHSLVSIARSLGCAVIECPLREEHGYEVDVDELAALLSDKTKAIIVNFPHNPTGTSVDHTQQKVLVELAESMGIYLVWDEVFTEIVHRGQPLPPSATLSRQAISFGTLSKAYGLPGLRVGWCVATPEIVEQSVRIRDYTTLALSPVVEYFALMAIQHADALLLPRLEEARRNLAILTEWAERHRNDIALTPPDGGVAVFPRLLGRGSATPFCDRLQEEHGVLLVPGECFGQPEHFRLGFGVPTEELLDGLARIDDVLVSH